VQVPAVEPCPSRRPPSPRSRPHGRAQARKRPGREDSFSRLRSARRRARSEGACEASMKGVPLRPQIGTKRNITNGSEARSVRQPALTGLRQVPERLGLWTSCGSGLDRLPGTLPLPPRIREGDAGAPAPKGGVRGRSALDAGTARVREASEPVRPRRDAPRHLPDPRRRPHELRQLPKPDRRRPRSRRLRPAKPSRSVRRRRFAWIGTAAGLLLFAVSLAVLWTVVSEVDAAELRSAFTAATAAQIGSRCCSPP
jgi:hypothetical protein